MSRFVFIIIFSFLTSCLSVHEETSVDINMDRFPKGALLTTSFSSLEDFKEEVDIVYSQDGKPWVELTHSANQGQVVSLLKSGVSEADFMKAKAGGFWDKVKLGFKSPYFVSNRMDLQRVYFLSRRRNKDFGWPDKAFYDLAESMKNNISKEDQTLATKDELSDKGYVNTFNHIVAQALMTTLFSEALADFVADTHERKNLPELITGDFTEKQRSDIKNGAVDNYVDIINNEWGQELGKLLKLKYNIDRKTIWDSELLANYLNELQSYFGYVFKIRFKPFTSKDEITTRFSLKINRIMDDVSGLW